jgi:hypothetical protein
MQGWHRLFRGSLPGSVHMCSRVAAAQHAVEHLAGKHPVSQTLGSFSELLPSFFACGFMAGVSWSVAGM